MCLFSYTDCSQPTAQSRDSNFLVVFWQVEGFVYIERVPTFQTCTSIPLEKYWSQIFQTTPFDVFQDSFLCLILYFATTSFNLRLLPNPFLIPCMCTSLLLFMSKRFSRMQWSWRRPFAHFLSRGCSLVCTIFFSLGVKRGQLQAQRRPPKDAQFSPLRILLVKSFCRMATRLKSRPRWREQTERLRRG